MTDRHGRNRILFVCTANICRSATAELLARRRFGEEVSVFRSAGFLEPGHAVPSDLVKVLAERGVDASAHRSYRLDSASVAAADVLLTMESSHIQRITTISPEALAKSVPIKEAVALQGHCTNEFRLPLVGLGPAQATALKELLEGFELV